ncbi:restriction endonuclease subunit S [Riemerella anatipestifer]|nr:restriction endonuclease subunit S [Riemerella anatipestifer]MDY3325842.1 restriction endonuclease subunit S [Riemerella anatipestifer]MDY3354384.1 restriction endonuclease subunit S [Riemerella anatipestifer]
MTWKKTKLKDLGWLRSAGVNKLSEVNQKEVRLLNYMDVYRNQKISNKIDFQIVTAKDYEINNANLEVGDILFTPSSEKPTDIGHAGIVIEELPNTVYSYHLVRFRPDEPNIFNPHFLAYALNSFECEKHFITRATGTTRYTLSKSDFKRLEFEYPENPAEQTAIATILSKVDEAIAATQNSIKAAEKLKKALMQNLLTGKLKPDGSWRSEDEFYEDEKFGKVPKGWEVKKLKDVAVCLDSKRKPIKAEDRKSIQGVYPYYGAAGIIDYINDYIFDGRYLLFGEDGENLISRKVPQAFIVDGKFWVNNHAHILKEIENVSDLDFLCFSLESKNYENIVYGSAQPKINKSDLYKIKVLNPLDLNEQEMIAKKLNDSEGLITQKQTKIQTLQRLKKSLMQNLLTGKVRLPKAFIAQFEAVEEINNTIKTI